MLFDDGLEIFFLRCDLDLLIDFVFIFIFVFIFVFDENDFVFFICNNCVRIGNNWWYIIGYCSGGGSVAVCRSYFCVVSFVVIGSFVGLRRGQLLMILVILVLVVRRCWVTDAVEVSFFALYCDMPLPILVQKLRDSIGYKLSLIALVDPECHWRLFRQQMLLRLLLNLRWVIIFLPCRRRHHYYLFLTALLLLSW